MTGTTDAYRTVWNLLTDRQTHVLGKQLHQDFYVRDTEPMNEMTGEINGEKETRMFLPTAPSPSRTRMERGSRGPASLASIHRETSSRPPFFPR